MSCAVQLYNSDVVCCVNCEVVEGSIADASLLPIYFFITRSDRVVYSLVEFNSPSPVKSDHAQRYTIPCVHAGVRVVARTKASMRDTGVYAGMRACYMHVLRNVT